MLILGIETSCDETSVALVEDGRHARSNYIASQVKLHAQFGGVVPEVASRAHMQRLIPMLGECLASADVSWSDIDAVAVTLGPGLIGALHVGVETAKTLAFAQGKPLIPPEDSNSRWPSREGWGRVKKTPVPRWQLVVTPTVGSDDGAGHGIYSARSTTSSSPAVRASSSRMKRSVSSGRSSFPTTRFSSSE